MCNNPNVRLFQVGLKQNSNNFECSSHRNQWENTTVVTTPLFFILGPLYNNIYFPPKLLKN